MKKLLFILSLFVFLAGCHPCANNRCQNGGVCIDGTCECPAGYDAEDCSLELVPDSVIIHEIKVLNVSLRRPDGSVWNPYYGNTETLDLAAWILVGYKDNGDAEIYNTAILKDVQEEEVILKGRDFPISIPKTALDKGLLIRLKAESKSEGAYIELGKGWTDDCYPKGEGFPEKWVMNSTQIDTTLKFEFLVSYKH